MVADISNLYLCKCPSVKKQTRSNKPTKKYNYKSRRPVNRMGHSACIDKGGRIPGNMGWLWTEAHPQAIGKGWKPGAIAKNTNLPMSEILLRNRLEHLKQVNTVRKSFCRINVDPSASKSNDSPLQVDCSEDNVQIVVNPPKDLNMRNSVDKNEPMTLNITRKLQTVEQKNKEGSATIVHKTPSNVEEFNIEYTPPTSWIKMSPAKRSTSIGTQCSRAQCPSVGTSNTSLLQKSFENRLRSNTKINSNKPKFVNVNTKPFGSKMSSDNSTITFGSRTKLIGDAPSRIPVSRNTSYNTMNKLKA